MDRTRRKRKGKVKRDERATLPVTFPSDTRTRMNGKCECRPKSEDISSFRD